MKKISVLLLTAAILCSSLPLPAFAASGTAATKDTAGGEYTVTASELYVRSGPGASYDKLGSLDKGKTVSGTVKDGWLSFEYNGKAAYCSAQYLSALTAAAAVGDSWVVTASKLYIRSGPGTSYPELGSLPKGKTLSGSVKDGWVSFTYDGKNAYCSAQYLKAQ